MSEKKSSDRDKLESALSELFDVTAERDKLRKAFALACRIFGDNFCCPLETYQERFPGCNGKTKACRDIEEWNCWQRHFLYIADNEQVCRVCGCTEDNACPGGCSWVEPDLCSRCVESEEAGANAEKSD